MLVIASGPNRRRVEAIVRWLRTLVPAAMLVVSPLDTVATEALADAITLDADALPSGPLSVAERSLTRASSPR